MKITITRAFERTRQIADFVPIKAYCEASVEIDLISVTIDGKNYKADVDAAIAEQSEKLDQFVQSEVEKTLITYRPVCIRCKGKGDTVILNKEGICGQCVNEMAMDARQFKIGNDKNRAAKAGQKSPTESNG